MSKTSKRAGLLVLLATLLASGAVVAQRPRGDQFTATIASLEGGGTAPVVVHLDHYSSDQEVQKLRGILDSKGPNALRDALWDLEAGYIRVGGGLGYPVAVARSKPEANGGRVVRLMIDRPISFRESVGGTRSRDYPFSYVEIHLDRNGRGEGKMIAAAKVSLTAGTVDIESYGNQPLRLLQVRER